MFVRDSVRFDENFSFRKKNGERGDVSVMKSHTHVTFRSALLFIRIM